MAGFNLTEWIARPQKQVFDFITDSRNAPKIGSNTKEMIKLTEGPVGVGTRYSETRIMNGKEAVAELEIVEFQPPQKYSVKNVTEGIDSVYHYSIQPEKDGTRINLVCEVTASGVKKLMTPMVASILKKEDGDHLQRLKKAMEE